MNIAVVKYNAGNIYSVTNALRRLGIEPTLTDNPELLGKADKIICPGKGNGKEAMACLRRNRLDVVLKNLRQPVLGICVGQQLLCRHSEEGDAECIGVFDAVVKKFHPLRHEDKVPAMGWQEITTTENPLLANLGAHPYVYFVHSYYVPLCEHTIATAEYILPYSACMHKDNFYTCQFHPEKSGKTGELILQNFVEL